MSPALQRFWTQSKTYLGRSSRLWDDYVAFEKTNTDALVEIYATQCSLEPDQQPEFFARQEAK